MSRTVDAMGLIRWIPWVRARNASGDHVYCRPLCSRHVLVDDLWQHQLDALVAAHGVAAVVETSKGNYQAWVTVAQAEVDAPVASAAARILARQFGGDPGAASAHQLGRLVGTTNRKLRHQREDGSFPFVLLRRSVPLVDPAGSALLAEAADDAQRHSQEPLAATPAVAPNSRAFCEAAEARRRIVASLRCAIPVDRSRVDFSAARRRLRRGGGAEAALRMVLAGDRAREMSPAAAIAYATRTVCAARLAIAREADHGRPLGAGKGRCPEVAATD
ncbi:DNA-primase RepB domain-containing protein [Falsiroseomonas sp. HW251]|uniref:DNA-primase RepB domain-containing protein n=1 Tax=Falsiroseomonas sp. HW251 TaxID=3390998 RepID=UPI003D312242